MRPETAIAQLEIISQRERAEAERKKAGQFDVGKALIGAITAGLTGGWSLPLMAAGAISGGISGAGDEPMSYAKAGLGGMQYATGLKEKEESLAMKKGEQALEKEKLKLGTLKEFDWTPSEKQDYLGEGKGGVYTYPKPEGAFEAKEMAPSIFEGGYLSRKMPAYDPLTLMLMEKMGITAPNKANTTQTDSSNAPVGATWTDPKTGKQYKKIRPSTANDEGWDLISGMGGGLLG